MSTEGSRLVPDLLRDRVKNGSQATALIAYGKPPLSYDQWARRSSSIAHGLVRNGVRPGDRVALLFAEAEWDEYAVSHIAVHKAGATAVPLLSSLDAVYRQRIAEAVGARMLLTGSSIEVSGGHALLLHAADIQRRYPANDIQVAIEPGATADINYTSGSTGTPKAVRASHANLTTFYEDFVEGVAASGMRTTVGFHIHATPIGTTAAQKLLIHALCAPSTTFVALPYFEPGLFVRAIEEYQASKVGLVPAMAVALARSTAIHDGGLPAVREVFLSSSAVTRKVSQLVADMFPQADIYDVYGSSEGGWARLFRRLDSMGDQPFRPMAPTAVRVVDKHNVDVNPGVVGRVLLHDPSPRRSYDDDESASRLVFAGGWVQTGDLGYLTEDGGLYLTGRADDVIVSGGLNIAPLEVEEVLMDHPLVNDAAVVGIPHDVLGETVAAAIVPSVAATPDPTMLRSFALAALGRAKAPRRIVLVKELPRVASLKIDRRALRELLLESRRPVVGDMGHDNASLHRKEASSLRLAAVLEVTKAVLGSTDPMPDDDFFELGLDSLSAAEVITQLGTRFPDVKLDPWACFDHFTPRRLAMYLTETQKVTPG